MQDVREISGYYVLVALRRPSEHTILCPKDRGADYITASSHLDGLFGLRYNCCGNRVFMKNGEQRDVWT